MKRCIQIGFILLFLVFPVAPSWGSDLYADFAGAGISQWNSTAWSQLNGIDPASMVASGSNLYANIAGSGIWQWNSTVWSQLNGIDPANMVASGSILYGDFTGGGIWE